MQRFHHLAQRVFNRTHAVMDDRVEGILAALSGRLGIAIINGAAVQPQAWDYGEAEDQAYRDYARGYDLCDGVALIGVEGTLVHKLGSARPFCGMTGYDGIRNAFAGALADDTARAIVLDIDSPGGEVSGCFDLADAILAARGTKPIVAILSEMAASAAYAIASACDHITVPRTGCAGSIGVVYVHSEVSKLLDKEGIAVRVFRSGERKMEGDQFTPLTKVVEDRIQAEIDSCAKLFFETVARNRGLDAATIKGWQGEAFNAADALRLGLVDTIMAPDQAMAELVEALRATAA